MTQVPAHLTTGLAPLNHTHTPEECDAAPVVHTHVPVECGAAPLVHTHTPEDIGAAPEIHTHIPSECGAADVNHTHTPASIGAAEDDHTHAVATTTDAGFMSATNFQKLIGLVDTVVHTTTEWNTLNPILSKGTLCIEDKGTGYFSIKVADGTTTWKLLPALMNTDTPIRTYGGILASGNDTIALPWQYDLNSKNILVFLGTLKQRSSTLTYVDSTHVKVGMAVPQDTEFEVILIPTSISTEQNISNFNYIIDGAFDFWYEGTSQTTNGYGSATMWNNAHNGSSKTTSRQSFSVGELFPDGVPAPTYFIRTDVTSVAGAGNYVSMHQKLEDVRRFAGKTMTLSFYAKADSNKNISVEMTQVFGTGGSPSDAVASLGVTKIALTTVWTKYTITVALPSIAGKTLGTNDNNYFSVNFWFDAGSTFNTNTDTLGQQSGSFDITLVKLEDGDTPYLRDVGLEETRIGRFYQRYGGNASSIRFRGYFSVAGSSLAYTIPLSQPMRSTPIITLPTMSNSNVSSNFTYSGKTSFCFGMIGSAIGDGASHNPADQYISLDARL